MGIPRTGWLILHLLLGLVGLLILLIAWILPGVGWLIAAWR